MISVEKPGSPTEILEHFGKKGMKWGVRNTPTRSSGGKTKGGRTKRVAKALGRTADTAAFIYGGRTAEVQGRIAEQASTKLMKNMSSIKARHGDYGKLSNRMKKPFSKEAKAYRADVKKTYLRHLESTANSMTNAQGTLRYTLKENGKPNTSQYFWEISVERVEHAANGTFKVRPVFDDEGWIVNIELIDDEMEQTMDRGINFLIHTGIEV